MPARGQGVVWVLALVLLTGCASGSRPDATGQPGLRRITLTRAQSEAVTDGVKQMVANPQTAQLSAVTATARADTPAVHVCGYVKTKDAGGKDGPDLPFYVELLATGGKPVAERGQVGDEPSKRSKVTFMCRHNG